MGRFSEGPDLTLIVEDEEVPIYVAAEEGAKLILDGIAPETPNQFRVDPFGYESIDPRVSTPVRFEDWAEGCGFEEGRDAFSRETPLRVRRYNYTQGVDLSWPGRGLKSPARQVPGGVDAAPTKFFYSTTLGVFALATTSIWEWNSTTWTERDDAASDGANYTDITELDAVLYAARGSSRDYKYSTNGTSWTAFTDADLNYDHFAVRSGESNQGILWGIQSSGLIRNTPDGQNSGTSWTLADAVGHTSEAVTGLLEGDDGNLYVFKREGIYRYTGTVTEDVWKSKYLSTENGKKAYRHSDGRFYAPYGNGLLQFDPLVEGTTLVHVFPGQRRVGKAEITGNVTAIGGDEQWLYIAVKNGAGNTYILKGLPDLDIWHTFLYLGANDCNALLVVPEGTVHASNPVLLMGVGASAQHVVLPRPGYDPETDSNYAFDTTDGFVIGPWLDYGAQSYEKFLNAGRTVMRNATSSLTIVLSYDSDDGGSFTDLLTSTSAGRTEKVITSDVSFNRIRYKATLTTGSTDSTPIWLGSVLEATPNPPRLRNWRPRVLMLDEPRQNSGGRSRFSASKTKRLLLKSPTVRCQLRDGAGSTYVVKVLDIGPGPSIDTQDGGRHRNISTYDMNIVEVGVVSLGTTELLIWDLDAWNTGKVYGD